MAEHAVRGLQSVSDADLLLAAARHDQAAFREIISRHYAAVYRVVWRLTGGHADSEDIAQEAFLRLWNNPGQLRDGGALKGWLMRVAGNLAMDRFRARPTQALDAVDEPVDGRASAEDQHMQVWARTRIDQAVARLPERQRLALTLVHFEQMSNVAAADVLEVSVDALESLLARARRALKTELAADRQSLLAAVTMEG
jgi:RNA polymerase sigma-70 factor (ECF subfamily)